MGVVKQSGKFVAGWRRRGCRSLLCILTLLLMLFPVLEEMARPILLCTIISSVFLAGVIVVEAGASRIKRAIMLSCVQITLAGIAVTQNVNSFPYLLIVGFALAAITALISYSMYCVLSYVLHAQRITRDQVYAGICAYLMLGFAFGCIYYLVEILAPGCFSVNVAKLGDSPDLMYFSFVTLATLGYGDITPAAKISRALAEVEALAGMLYIAVFMARLVSMVSSGPPNMNVNATDSSHNLPVNVSDREQSDAIEPMPASQAAKPFR